MVLRLLLIAAVYSYLNQGVDVVLGASRAMKTASWIYPTAITNQGTQAVILVSLKLGVYSPNGELLEEKTVAVWKPISVWQIPTDQNRCRRYIAFNLAVDQYPEYQIKAKIVEVLDR